MPPSAQLKSEAYRKTISRKSSKDFFEVAAALARSRRYQAVLARHPGAVWVIEGCSSDEGDVLYYEANGAFSYRPGPQDYPPNHSNYLELFLPGITPTRKVIGLRN